MLKKAGREAGVAILSDRKVLTFPTISFFTIPCAVLTLCVLAFVLLFEE